MAAENDLNWVDFLSLLESWMIEEASGAGSNDLQDEMFYKQMNKMDISGGINLQQKKVEVRAALLNIMSVNKKLFDFKTFTKNRELKVFLITETWLKIKNEDKLIKKARSQNFTVYHKMRKEKRGGGVAIVVSNDLESKSVEFELEQPDTKNKPEDTKNKPEDVLEHVAAKLKHKQWDKPVLFVNVYRPPGGSSDDFQAFLKVFQEILDQAKSYNKLIVTGDFNIWVDDKKDAQAEMFKTLLENEKNNGLVQHVNKPTHKKGNILDLLISRNVTVSGLKVHNDNISDHYTVYFNI